MGVKDLVAGYFGDREKGPAVGGFKEHPVVIAGDGAYVKPHAVPRKPLLR